MKEKHEMLYSVKQLDRRTRWLKRSLDLLVGGLLLLLSLPVILFAALAVRMETKGSPLFLQKRVGLGGRTFTIYKMRGMYVDARKRFPHLYDYAGRSGLDFKFHDEADPRVTKVGAFLRRTSIDELPNLWNVVRGDMSLVGPRPELPEVLRLYGDKKEQYLSVKPGITCASKVSGRDHLSKQETVAMDLNYIETMSLRQDAQLLWKTCVGVLLRKDVYDGQAAAQPLELLPAVEEDAPPLMVQ